MNKMIITGVEPHGDGSLDFDVLDFDAQRITFSNSIVPEDPDKKFRGVQYDIPGQGVKTFNALLIRALIEKSTPAQAAAVGTYDLATKTLTVTQGFECSANKKRLTVV